MNADNLENLLVLPAGVELGKYRIIRTLGQGGFGITYLAQVVDTGEEVVIKENLPTFCALRDRTSLSVAPTNPRDEQQEFVAYRQRFVEEARLLARLDHPNIVKVLAAFEALGTAYYVMPWVGGLELQKAAPSPKVIDEAWLQPILRTLLEALQYLHSNNIYHRDVKPANILLTEDGTPVLIDFGTARSIISDRSATHVGSPGYSPIEQLRTKGKRGPWTDVYSVGATCYRLITGERPPEAFDRIDEDEDPLRPLAPRAELRKRFSADFLAGIDKALSQRARDRWQSTTEWLAALPSHGSPTDTTEPQSRRIAINEIRMEPAPRPRRNVALVVLIIFLALSIPGGYMLYQHAQAVSEQRLRDEHARQEAERQAREEAERQAREEAERQARMVREEAERALSEQGISKSEYGEKLVKAYDKPELQRLLIAAGADVNYVDKKGYFPLFWVAYNGSTEGVKRLLAVPGIDVNNQGGRGDSALYEAAGNGHPECVKLLLAAPGIDVNNESEYGDTPLHEAAEDGRIECMKLLLAAPGIDVNNEGINERTPLQNAAEEGYTDAVKLLLDAPGIEVNRKGQSGNTPLHSAAEAGQPECVRALLNAPGIDVQLTNDEGKTPLQVAREKVNMDCALLLEAASEGRPLPQSLPRISRSEARKRLQKKGIATADYNEKLDFIKSAELLKLLIAAGADVNAVSGGNPALHWPAYQGRVECVKLLLSAPGIEVNKRSEDGWWTPLKAAKIQNRTECARLLREAGGTE